MCHASRQAGFSCLVAVALCSFGCTSLPDYVKNGGKVGPEYTAAKADVAPQWIDSGDPRIVSRAADLGLPSTEACLTADLLS